MNDRWDIVIYLYYRMLMLINEGLLWITMVCFVFSLLWVIDLDSVTVWNMSEEFNFKMTSEHLEIFYWIVLENRFGMLWLGNPKSCSSMV